MPPKQKAKLPPVPRPARRKPAPSPHTGEGRTADPSAPPDLSRIAEGLRPLAVPLGELAFMAGNAVTHSDDQLGDIRASLRTFGQVEPLVVNRRESPAAVIGGNGRLQAMLLEGWTHAAVTFVDLPREKANALSIALNRTADGREWDAAALDALLRECDTGNDERLDAMLSELAADVGIVPPEEQEAKPPTADPPADEAQPARITCPNCHHQFDGVIRVTEAPEVPPEAPPAG